MPQHKNPIIILLVFIFIFLCCLISACGIMMWRSMNHINRFSTDQQRAIMFVKNKFPTLNDYPNDSNPLRTIALMNSDGGWYVAFIQRGSTRPILESKCFFVDAKNNVEEIGTYLPDTSDDSAKEFSPKTCLPEGGVKDKTEVDEGDGTYSSGSSSSVSSSATSTAMPTNY